MKVQDSDLARLFEKQEQLITTETGEIFLDRCGVSFGYVLEYLRNDFVMPQFDSKQEEGKFNLEIDFWKLSMKFNPTFIELKKIFENKQWSKAPKAKTQ